MCQTMQEEEEKEVRHCRNLVEAMTRTQKAHTKSSPKPFDEISIGLLRRPMKKFWQNAGQDINSMRKIPSSIFNEVRRPSLQTLI